MRRRMNQAPTAATSAANHPIRRAGGSMPDNGMPYGAVAMR
jgi:hypothetical protein